MWHTIWYPHSVTPTTDPWLWGRWFLGVALVWWLPGRILLRGRLRGWPHALTVPAHLAAGFVWVVVLGLVMRDVGRGLPILGYVVASPLLACAAGVLAGRNDAVSAPDDGARSRPTAWWWLVGASSLLLFVTVCAGFRDFCAPPHVHDASNHAFLVARAARTGSLDPALIYAHVHPVHRYLPGWHLTAAVTGTVAGVAPYISAWFTAITVVALVPWSLAMLWWRWGAGAALSLAGVAWVVTNGDVPAGLPFSWGGFGQQVGFFLAPMGAVLAADALRSLRWPVALATGVFLAAMVNIHFSEVMVVVVLGALTWGMTRHHHGFDAVGSTRMRLLAASAFLVGLALAFDPAILRTASGAVSAARQVAARDQVATWGRALRVFLLQIGPPDVRFVWLIGGLAWLLAQRRWRPVGVTCLLLGAWLVALQVWHDPVSRILAMPFYGQAARVAYLQIFVMPLAAGAATVALLRALRRRGRTALVAGVLVTLYPLGAGFVTQVPGLESLASAVPFTRDDYALACAIGDTVGDGEVVANDRDDGSTWAAQVSGVAFLCPMSWECIASDGTRLREGVRGLRDDPWPASTRGLVSRGVRWLYVSDHRLRGVPANAAILTPGDFADDPRFAPVLTRDGSQLLRIKW